MKGEAGKWAVAGWERGSRENFVVVVVIVVVLRWKKLKHIFMPVGITK